MPPALSWSSLTPGEQTLSGVHSPGAGHLPGPHRLSARLFLKLRSHRKTLAASALPTDARICKGQGRKVGAGAGTSGIREHGSVHHCPWPLGGSWRLSERLHWAWEPPTWAPLPALPPVQAALVAWLMGVPGPCPAMQNH